MKITSRNSSLFLLSLFCLLLLGACQKASTPSQTQLAKPVIESSQPRPSLELTKKSSSQSVLPAQTRPGYQPTAEPTAIPEPTPPPELIPTPEPTPPPIPAPTVKPSPTPLAQPDSELEEKPAEKIGDDQDLPITDLKDELLEFESLSFYRPEHEERYLAYQAKMGGLAWQKVIDQVNIGLDLPYYSEIKIIKNEHALDVLVNKYNKLPDGFKPQNLVSLPAEYAIGAQQMTDQAAQAFMQMSDAAAAAGYTLKAYSSYRSLAAQAKMWQDKMDGGRTVENVDAWNARSGHSEHHLGLTVDINKDKPAYWKKGAEFYQTGLWLQEDAHKFGFILRYPAGKANITGYQAEPWHFRYLGLELAGKVKASGLTYDEYYERYRR